MANNTKWTEFLAEVQRLRWPLKVKLIDEDSLVQCESAWCPVPNWIEGHMGPYPFYWLEWVEFANTAEVEALAAKVGLECVSENGITRVYGYR